MIVVHDRLMDDRLLNLGVYNSAKHYDGNLVMADVQTGTLWVQRTGAGLDGPNALAGQKLRELPPWQYKPGIRWDEWRAKHPDSEVVRCKHCLPRRTGAAQKRPSEHIGFDKGNSE